MSYVHVTTWGRYIARTGTEQLRKRYFQDRVPFGSTQIRGCEGPFVWPGARSRCRLLKALRADDPTAGVNAARPVVKSHGHMTWGEEQIAAYRHKHPIGTMARLAIELVLNIGARRGDAHLLGAQHIKRGRIEWRPNKTIRKTGKQLQIRILPELQTALDAMPAKDTSLAFLLNSYGKPFASAAAFGNKFADRCKQAGLKPVLCADGQTRSYRIHGLRKAACVALAHAQCTGPEIMAVSGHSNLAQVQVYIEEAQQDLMADAAIEKLRART